VSHDLWLGIRKHRGQRGDLGRSRGREDLTCRHGLQEHFDWIDNHGGGGCRKLGLWKIGALVEESKGEVSL
jgi:hypothetical protein